MVYVSANELKQKGVSLLDDVIAESRKDLKEGKFVEESVEAHIDRIQKEFNPS